MKRSDMLVVSGTNQRFWSQDNRVSVTKHHHFQQSKYHLGCTQGNINERMLLISTDLLSTQVRSPSAWVILF